MFMTARRQVESGVVEDVLCNKCGKSCRNEAFAHDGIEHFDFTVLKYETGSYGSAFDGVNPDEPVHLCDVCCIALLLSLKLQPKFWCNYLPEDPEERGKVTPQEIWGNT